MRRRPRFKWIGAGAVALSGLFLVLLLSTIVTEALPAFRMNYLTLPIDLSAAKVDPANPGAANYATIAQDALAAKFPGVESRQDRRLLRGMLSTGSGDILRRDIANDPALLGKTVDYAFPLDDFADLYLKGLIADKSSDTAIATTVAPSATTGDIEVAFGDDSIARLARGYGAIEENGVLRLTSGAASLFVAIDGGIVKLTEFSPGDRRRDVAKGSVLKPLDSNAAAASGAAMLRVIDTPESSRKISDKEIVWLDELKAQNLVESRFNSIFLFTGASREPELAGIWGAVVGSFLTMIVTLAIAFPIGVSAAIYLEEFAPEEPLDRTSSRSTSTISRRCRRSCYGLLGLAVFLNFFGLPRSAPVVGGMVLALMTLPIIIIASRASLARGAAIDPRSGARHRRLQGADGLPSRSAAGDARHHDRHDPRHGACARRNRAAADDRHGRLHRRHSGRLHRSGDYPSGADLHVGGFS